MRAIRVSEFGGPEVLKLIKDVPVPQASEGQVRLKHGLITHIVIQHNSLWKIKRFSHG